MRRARSSLIAAGAVVLLAYVVAQVLPRPGYVSALNSPEPDSQIITVGHRQTDLPRSVDVQLEWAPPRSLYTGKSTSGLLTDVLIRAGDTLRCGQPVLEVDGREVTAYCAKRPRWQQSSGGVWIGPEPVTLGEVLVESGGLVQANSAIARVAPQLLGARVPAHEASGRSISVDGEPRSFELSPDGHVDDLDGFAQALSQAGSGEAAVGIDRVPATSRLATPVDISVVPPQAIVSGESGACVFTGPGEPAAPVAVLSSAAEGVLITSAEPLDRVWLSPPDGCLP